VANFAHMYATIASIVLFAVLAVGVLQWVETQLFRPEKRSAKCKLRQPTRWKEELSH
jgi:hypothetical protein